MSDSLTPEKRSWNMSRIHGKDTRIEVLVRKYLFSQGFRYRKNVASLPVNTVIHLKPELISGRTSFKRMLQMINCMLMRFIISGGV